MKYIHVFLEKSSTIVKEKKEKEHPNEKELEKPPNYHCEVIQMVQ